MKLTVLNPKGHDPEQYFDDYAGQPTPDAHAPVNYHAYAACLAGSFQRDVSQAIALGQPVLLLLRNDLKLCLKALRQVKAAGLPVAVTLKETGYHQFHKLLDSGKKLRLLREILQLGDGVISPTEALVTVYRALRPDHPAHSTCFIATPYPVDDPRWDFSVPVGERRGVFIGTRELHTPSRNHLQSLILIKSVAEQIDCPIGIVSADDKRLAQFLDALDFPSHNTSIKGRMSYPEYLRFMARYKVVFQLDQSMVPGQVAGDSTLTRQIALGGNGSVDELVFPEYCGASQKRDALLDNLTTLLRDDGHYARAVAASAERARRLLSFEEGAGRLRAFFRSLGPRRQGA